MPALQLAQLVVTALLAITFLFMGVMHFVPSRARGMAAMIPHPFTRIASRKALVRVTGVCELLGGLGLLSPLHAAATIALILFLIAVFPANAYASQHPERFGRAAIPFWPRLIGQIVLIGVLAFQLPEVLWARLGLL